MKIPALEVLECEPSGKPGWFCKEIYGISIVNPFLRVLHNPSKWLWLKHPKRWLHNKRHYRKLRNNIDKYLRPEMINQFHA